MNPVQLTDYKNGRIHFIGIGGSGMYPLVQILHKKGYYITGSVAAPPAVSHKSW